MTEAASPPPPIIPPKVAAANTAFAEGRLGDAVNHLISALEEQPALPVKVYRVLIANLLRLGRFEEGLTWATNALNLVPDDPEIHNFTGILLNMKGQPADAIQAFDRVLAGEPNHRGALTNKGLILNQLRDGAGAETIFRTLLAAEDENPDLHRSLGKSLWTQRKFPAAAESLQRAVTLAPNNVDAWLDLSALAADMGDPAGALGILDSAIAAVPDDARLAEAKAIMFRRAGLIDRLGPYLESIAGRFSETGWYQHEIGLFTARFDRQRANHHYRRAVELDPANPQYRTTLVGNLSRTRGIDEGAYLDEAVGLLHQLPVQAQRKASNVAVETFLLAADHDALQALGSIAELGREWAATDHHSALLLQFPRATSEQDRREIFDQHRLWGEKALARAARHPIVHPASPRPTAKIRIGFMSSDLREHPVTYFTWPLFEQVDRDRFEIYCYSFARTAEPSPLQEQLAAMVDGFRWHPFITDRDAAQMIADDQLDILFELGGSTYMNKLEVMAWRPAKLGVSWLGYPHSSGLSTIDHLLVDPYLNPPDSTLLIEKPLIMPKSWITMSDKAFPDSHVIDPVAPVRRNGFVTFGTANNPYKYNADMLRTWARVLAHVRNSRFVFVRPEAGSQVFQRNIRARFASEGVAGDRIEFRAVRGGHMPHYNDIDITLDTFPQTGGTTTCEALWMGVPTASLVGEALFERLSYSILQNAGLGDLCATTPEQFIDIAVALAADTDRLQALRTGLRDQIRAGPLGQTRQFAEDFYDLVASAVAADTGKGPLPSTVDPS